MLTQAIDNAKWLGEHLLRVGEGAVDTSASNLGCEKLGSGFYSYVYSHPGMPCLAIKLCFDEREMGVTYLAWARAHPGLHIPRVHHLARNRTGKGYFAVLDLLFPLSAENRRRVNACGVTDSPYIYSRGEDTLVDSALNIYEFFKDICGWDLHSGNVLQDINGTVVITDPVTQCYQGSGDLRTGIERAYGVPVTPA